MAMQTEATTGTLTTSSAWRYQRRRRIGSDGRWAAVIRDRTSCQETSPAASFALFACLRIRPAMAVVTNTA